MIKILFSLGLLFFFAAPTVSAAADYSFSPDTYSALGDSFNFTVGATNYGGSTYAACFLSDGSAQGRCNDSYNQTLGTASLTVGGLWTSQPTAEGVLHMIVVNVDAGSGFDTWSSNCWGTNTYTDCIAFLSSDRAGQYVDLTMTFAEGGGGGGGGGGTGTTTPSIGYLPDQQEFLLLVGLFLFILAIPMWTVLLSPIEL